MTLPADFRAIRLLLVGATGAVGHEVLQAALADPRVSCVVAPTRRALPPHNKLVNPVVDFPQLPQQADWWGVDAVVCALGSTLKQAGSQEAFALVDRDWPIQIAQRARQAGASRFALNSSLGASARGNFYLKTKAQAEQGIRAIGYPSYTIVRPSLIHAHRSQVRPGEQWGLWIARVFKGLIPLKYRPVKASQIAQALLDSVLRGSMGEKILESDSCMAEVSIY